MSTINKELSIRYADIRRHLNCLLDLNSIPFRYFEKYNTVVASNLLVNILLMSCACECPNPTKRKENTITDKNFLECISVNMKRLFLIIPRFMLSIIVLIFFHY